MATEDPALGAVERIDLKLEQIRRDALRQARQSVRIANAAGDALGVPRVVVILRSEEVMTATCSSGA